MAVTIRLFIRPSPNSAHKFAEVLQLQHLPRLGDYVQPRPQTPIYKVEAVVHRGYAPDLPNVFALQDPDGIPDFE
ncbi:MAG TPA: hypothetical protein VF815_04930 [Myxococcaceae bacterium]|jgi:hypothetical protein